jgi:hypothetical protein
MFHGLANHGWDYLIIELSSTKKGNLETLMKDKPFNHKFSIELYGQ